MLECRGIKRLMDFGFASLTSIGFTALLSSAFGDVGDDINALTGVAETRLVWVSGTTASGNDELMGGGAIYGYDSQDKLAAHQIKAAAVGQRRPILCSNGTQLVYTVGSTGSSKVYIVDWSGSNNKFLINGECSDVWYEPATHKQWIVVTKDTVWNSTGRTITRHRLDSLNVALDLWTDGGAGTDYIDWFQTSSDGKYAVDFLPWPRCYRIWNGGLQTHSGTVLPGPGTDRRGLRDGCWSSVSHDNSYISFMFPNDAGGGHNVFDVFKDTLLWSEHLSITTPKPAGSIDENYHPRFATNGGRFLTITTGYQNSRQDSVEVCLGKFGADFRSFAGWVRVTKNTTPDYYPDAWVNVGTTDVPPTSVHQSLGMGNSVRTVCVTYSQRQGVRIAGLGDVSYHVTVTDMKGNLVAGRRLAPGYYTVQISGAQLQQRQGLLVR
jgi:hypothetical protein